MDSIVGGDRCGDFLEKCWNNHVVIFDLKVGAMCFEDLSYVVLYSFGRSEI